MFIFKINTIQESISMILSRCYTFIRMKWAKSPPPKKFFCSLKFQKLWVQPLIFDQVKEEKKGLWNYPLWLFDSRDTFHFHCNAIFAHKNKLNDIFSFTSVKNYHQLFSPLEFVHFSILFSLTFFWVLLAQKWKNL